MSEVETRYCYKCDREQAVTGKVPVVCMWDGTNRTHGIRYETQVELACGHMFFKSCPPSTNPRRGGKRE